MKGRMEAQSALAWKVVEMVELVVEAPEALVLVVVEVPEVMVAIVVQEVLVVRVARLVALVVLGLGVVR